MTLSEPASLHHKETKVGKEGANSCSARQHKVADVWSPENVCGVTASVKEDSLGHSNSTVAIDYTRCGHVSHLSNSANGLTLVQLGPQEGLYSLLLLS